MKKKKKKKKIFYDLWVWEIFSYLRKIIKTLKIFYNFAYDGETW